MEEEQRKKHHPVWHCTLSFRSSCSSNALTLLYDLPSCREKAISKAIHLVPAVTHRVLLVPTCLSPSLTPGVCGFVQAEQSRSHGLSQTLGLSLLWQPMFCGQEFSHAQDASALSFQERSNELIQQSQPFSADPPEKTAEQSAAPFRLFTSHFQRAHE